MKKFDLIEERKKSVCVCEDYIDTYLRSGPRVVNSGGNEHPAMSVNDHCSVIVTHIERFKILAGDGDERRS